MYSKFERSTQVNKNGEDAAWVRTHDYANIELCIPVGVDSNPFPSGQQEMDNMICRNGVALSIAVG